MAILSHSEALY